MGPVGPRPLGLEIQLYSCRGRGLVSPENKARYPVYTRDVKKEGQRIMAHGAIVGVVPMEDGKANAVAPVRVGD